MELIRKDLDPLQRDIDSISVANGPDQKKLKHAQDLLNYSIEKTKREGDEAERRKGELDREVSSLQSELGGIEDSIKKVMESYIAERVKFEVLAFKIRSTESEVREMERSEKEHSGELDLLKTHHTKRRERGE